MEALSASRVKSFMSGKKTEMINREPVHSRTWWTINVLKERTMQFVVRELAFHIVKHFFWHFVSSSFKFLIRFGVNFTIKEVYNILFRRFQIILFIISVLESVHENVIYFMHIWGYLLMNYCGR